MFGSLKRFMLAAFATFLLSGAGLASAVPITYSYWGSADGVLNGQSFDDADFLITASADTSTVGGWCCSNRQNTHVSVTMSLAGFGSFSITEATHTWVADNCCGGFGRNLANNLITFGNGIGTYDLVSNFGPYFDPGASTQGQFNNVSTSLGLLSVSNLNNGVTFEASVVPEPATYALMLGGLVAVGAMARRRRA